LIYAGWYDEAIDLAMNVGETFPETRFWMHEVLMACRLAGRYEEAMAFVEGLDPEQMPLTYHLLVPELLAALGRPREAKDYLERYAARAEEDSLYWSLCSAYAHLDAHEEARVWFAKKEAVVDKARLRRGYSGQPPFSLGWLAVILGDLDKAFAYFDEAYAHRSWGLTRLPLMVENDPDFAAVAADPRYLDLVGRLGLRE
jgi:tetratricopeptide (TPR) repeat protein